jgi:hypothetical protein
MRSTRQGVAVSDITLLSSLSGVQKASITTLSGGLENFQINFSQAIWVTSKYTQ